MDNNWNDEKKQEKRFPDYTSLEPGGIVISRSEGTTLQIVGGLSFDSTKEDAASVLGNEVTRQSQSDSGSYYSWYFEDGGYSTSLELDFEGSDLREIWIMNDQKLKQ